MRWTEWHPIDPQRMARVGFVAAAVLVPVLALDATLHDGLTGSLAAMVALAAIVLSAAVTIPLLLRGRADVRSQTLAFYAWSAVSAVALAAFVVAVGGDPRRYALVYGLFVAIAAFTYPLRGQYVVQPMVAASYATALIVADLPLVDVLIQLTIMGTLSLLAVQMSARLRSTTAAERTARADAERRAELIGALARMVTLDPDELMDRVVDALVELGFEIANIGVIREGYIFPDRVRGFEPGREPYGIPIDQGLAGRAITERRTAAVADYLAFDGRLPDREGVRSAIAVPLIADDEVIGVLIGARPTPGEPTASELEVIEVLAAHAGRALANAQLFEKERETVARLVELDEMKTDFVSNVSHELRTPLTVIRGLGETLSRRQDQLEASQVAELLTRLNANSERLGTMITALLDFSRFQSGTAEVTPRPVPIRGAVERLLVRLEPVLVDHVVATDVDDLSVLVDPALFEHVIENLVTNAVRHTPPGTRVHVGTDAVDGEVRIVVSDDGPGIAEEDLPYLTERFFRGGDVTRRRSGGLGLGLALCHQILQAHGASLDVESRVGAGTTFAFALPLVAPDGAGQAGSDTRSGSRSSG